MVTPAVRHNQIKFQTTSRTTPGTDATKAGEDVFSPAFCTFRLLTHSPLFQAALYRSVAEEHVRDIARRRCILPTVTDNVVLRHDTDNRVITQIHELVKRPRTSRCV